MRGSRGLPGSRVARASQPFRIAFLRTARACVTGSSGRRGHANSFSDSVSNDMSDMASDVALDCRAMATATERSDTRRRRAEARRDVLAKALELAEERPFRDITVDEIARAAGLSRSAFYTHFHDKHELLLAAVQEVADELYEMSERWWSGEGAPADRVRRALEGVVSVY